MSRLTLAFAAAAALAATLPASSLLAQAKPATKPAPTAKTTGAAKLPDSLRADAAFIHEAASDNMLEVRLAEVAEKRASNADVKQFAQRMVTDHNNLQNDLVSKAQQGGMTLKTALGPRHEQKLDRLQKSSSKQFDRTYMMEMVENHMDDVSYFQKEGRAAHTKLVRDHVEKALPLLQEHLTEAKRVAQKVGVDTASVARTHRVASK